MEGQKLIDTTTLKAHKKVKAEKKKEWRKKKDESSSSDAMKLADMYFSRFIDPQANVVVWDVAVLILLKDKKHLHNEIFCIRFVEQLFKKAKL